MRNFERLVWIVLVALFATLAFKKQPIVTLAAPPKAAIQIVGQLPAKDDPFVQFGGRAREAPCPQTRVIDFTK